MSFFPPHVAYGERCFLLVVPGALERFPKPTILIYNGMYVFAPLLDPGLLRLRLVQLAANVDIEFVEMAVGPSECVLDEAVDEVEIVVRGDFYGSENFAPGQAEVENVLCRMRRRELMDWSREFAACGSTALRGIRLRGQRGDGRIHWCAHCVVE